MNSFLRLSLACLLGSLLPFPLFAQDAPPDEVEVAVSKAVLRERPSALGKPVGQAAHRDRLEVLERRGAWLQVRASDADGWLARSATETKLVRFSTGGTLSIPASNDGAVAGARSLDDERLPDHAAELDRREARPAGLGAFLRQGGLRAE